MKSAYVGRAGSRLLETCSEMQGIIIKDRGVNPFRTAMYPSTLGFSE